MLFESSLASLEAPGACSAASLGRERFCGFNAAEQEGAVTCRSCYLICVSALAAGRGSTAKAVTAAVREGGGPGDGGKGNVEMVMMVAKAAMVAMDGGIYLLNVSMRAFVITPQSCDILGLEAMELRSGKICTAEGTRLRDASVRLPHTTPCVQRKGRDHVQNLTEPAEPIRLRH